MALESDPYEKCSASALPWCSQSIVCWLYQGWRIHGQIRFDRATDGTQSTVCRETTRKIIHQRNGGKTIMNSRDLHRYIY